MCILAQIFDESVGIFINFGNEMEAHHVRLLKFRWNHTKRLTNTGNYRNRWRIWMWQISTLFSTGTQRSITVCGRRSEQISRLYLHWRCIPIEAPRSNCRILSEAVSKRHLAWQYFHWTLCRYGKMQHLIRRSVRTIL